MTPPCPSDAAPEPDAGAQPQRRLPSWGAIGLGFAIAALVLFGPFPTCVFKLAVGAPCPGCGLTRATLALLRLDFAEALRLHPLAPVVAPLLGWLVARPLFVRLGWVSAPLIAPGGGARVTLVVVFVVALVWVVYLARLAGALGGHPDPVQLHEGWLTRWWF